MLNVIPRGLPRTGIALLRLAALVALVVLVARQPAPPQVGFAAVVLGPPNTPRQDITWRGRDKPFHFWVHDEFAGTDREISYLGPDPKLGFGDEIWVVGHEEGDHVAAWELVDLCDWRNRDCFVRHPEQLHGRAVPPPVPPFQ